MESTPLSKSCLRLKMCSSRTKRPSQLILQVSTTSQPVLYTRDHPEVGQPANLSESITPNPALSPTSQSLTRDHQADAPTLAHLDPKTTNLEAIQEVALTTIVEICTTTLRDIPLTWLVMIKSISMLVAHRLSCLHSILRPILQGRYLRIRRPSLA